MLLLLCQLPNASRPHTLSEYGGGVPPLEIQKAQTPVEGSLERCLVMNQGPQEVEVWGGGMFPCVLSSRGPSSDSLP